MADAALFGLVSDVLRSLASTAFQEFGRLRRLEADVSALKDTYTQIQAVLSDAEARQKHDKSVATWLKSLNISQFKSIRDVVSVGVGDGGETVNLETSSLIPTFNIYGRDAEVKTMAEKICRKDRIEHGIQGVRVYAIWGMGGVGKTTLAQLVYNHERVKAHFELQTWVHVSSEFQVKKITREIIESIDRRPCELSQLDAMQVELQNKLSTKKFFIVLDDVWIEDRDIEKWEELSKALNSGSEGSIVMVTTRNQTTSRMMAKVPKFQHQVGCLSEDDSWLLFKKLAFASQTPREGKNKSYIETIGKEIVHKCKGLPLAVKTLGGLMGSKRSINEWESVKYSDVWELQENNILPVLKLSYNSLLPDLKRCFAYCCLFPKGYEMKKVVLIDLWMVNGFLPTRREVDLYVTGEEFFYCLVSRSFLQVQDGNSMDLVCKMHDLMHDLARDVMRHDCAIIEPGKELITPDEVLHFSSTCSGFSFLDQDLERLRSLRSIFMFVDEYKGKIISQISNHPYLRMLLLDGIKVSRLPKSICKLKHLRYLSISGPNIEFLPESIIYLCNLQILNVQQCWRLSKLPDGMRYMKNLRCLNNQDCFRLKYMPVGMKELVCLERLAEFAVGKEKGAQIRELGDLNLLSGRLKIKRLENVAGIEEARSANLKHKTNLVSLKLCCTWSYRSEDDDDGDVFEGLEPNSSLRELAIEYYMGKMVCPSWMMKLGNLMKIEFIGCRGCESIPSLGKLPSLRVIHISFMDVLKCLDDDEFLSLQELSIYDCNQLAFLPSNLPKLERLYLRGVESLVSLPSNLPNLLKLEIKSAKALVCLPSNLLKLERLYLLGVESLVSLPSNHPNLLKLEIDSAKALVCLPSNLPKVERLYLVGLESLVSLPSNLPKLSELRIICCPKLHCLPDGLKELTSLEIWGCEILQRRCEKEKGEDWPKVSHVPDLRIQDHC